MKKAIGVDLGGTKLHLALVSESGTILSDKKLSTPVQAGGDAIQQLLIRELRAWMDIYGPLPIGLGTPGLVSFPDGKILGCTPNLPDWEQRSLKAVLEESLDTLVVVDNDANMAAWGEYSLNYASVASSMVMLTLGTGLGSGIILERQIHRGKRQLGIGFGHMIVNPQGRMCNCGQRGCLEAYVSGNGLLKGYRLRGGGLEIKGPEIFLRASQGESAALDTVNEFIEMLAIGISNILNTLAPEFLVLGGGISEQGEKLLLKPVQERISAIMSMPLIFPEMIALARLGASAGVVGAALLALNMEKTDGK